MKTTPLEDHIRGTYRALRWGLALLGPALPVVFLLWRLFGGVPLQHSMSAYYCLSGPTRDVFVGTLIAVGALLICYKGYTVWEDWALNLAGACVTGVALFHMNCPTARGLWDGSLHGGCAIAFFVLIAYVAVFRAADTLPVIGDARVERRYRLLYRVLGVAMVLSPLGAWVWARVIDPEAYVFFAEAAGVVAFSAYWIVKTVEVGGAEGAEALAARGELAAEPEGGVHPFRAIRFHRRAPAAGGKALAG